MRKLNKKGNFEKLVGFAIAIATLVVILMVTFIVLAQGKQQISSINGTNSVEYNASVSVSNSAALIPSFMPIIILAGIGAVVLAIVIGLKSRG